LATDGEQPAAVFRGQFPNVTLLLSEPLIYSANNNGFCVPGGKAPFQEEVLFMFTRLVSVAAFVCLLGDGASVAQDPTRVEATHYKLAFENEHVQVVSIHYGPHEKSILHEHPAGVVVNLTNGHLRFTDQNGNVQEVHAIHGEARWFPAVKHRVENLSDTTYDGIYVGVKGGANGPNAGSSHQLDPATSQIVAAILASQPASAHANQR
jgi:quercetin dioxygenase-like cupin family protein